jgi:hypothetical protein
LRNEGKKEDEEEGLGIKEEKNRKKWTIWIHKDKI